MCEENEENNETFRKQKTKDLATFFTNDHKETDKWKYPKSFKGIGDFAMAGTCLLDFFSPKDCMGILKTTIYLDNVEELAEDNYSPLLEWVFGPDMKDRMAIVQKYWDQATGLN